MIFEFSKTSQLTMRTRFAPSPTGELHLGGLRTALYSYALARRSHGQFFLRIEDTDSARTVPGAVDRLVAALDRVGLDRDGSLTQQSKRIPLYRSAAEELVQSGKAYCCFCSKERLDALRTVQAAANQPTRYDGKCSHVSKDEAKRRMAGGERYTVRMKAPMVGETVVEDEVAGKVRFVNATAMDDQILIKNDGWPTYHLASVVDDHDMKITHVVRGDEWLSSTPKHLALYAMLGWQPPKFAHLPLLLTPDGKKLSKRSPMGASVDSLLEHGYAPDALLNFVALLGWGVNAAAGVADANVVFTKSEFVSKFSLEQVNRSAAIVNEDRLTWLNGMHLRRAIEKQDDPVTLELAKQALVDACSGMDRFDEKAIDRVLFLLKDRVRFPIDFARLGGHFFQSNLELEPIPIEVATSKLSLDVLNALEDLVETQGEAAFPAVETLHVKLNCRKRDVLGFARWALTGQTVGAPIPETMQVLGTARTIERLQRAKQVLGQGAVVRGEVDLKL